MFEKLKEKAIEILDIIVNYEILQYYISNEDLIFILSIIKYNGNENNINVYIPIKYRNNIEEYIKYLEDRLYILNQKIEWLENLKIKEKIVELYNNNKYIINNHKNNIDEEIELYKKQIDKLKKIIITEGL